MTHPTSPILPPSLPVVVEDKQILHRAGEQGDRIGRVQTIRHEGRTFTVNFWYNQAGKLVRVV